MPELTKPKTPAGLAAFVHLGMLTASEAMLATGANHSLDCPFCYGENSLGICLTERVRDGKLISPGMWNCFKCAEAGNTASLLQKVHALAKQQGGDISPLSQDRGLPTDLLTEYGIVPALYGDQYWLPIYNEANILCNLYKYDIALKQSKSPYSFLGCPGCSAGLFNVQSLYSPPPGNHLGTKDLAAKRATYPVRACEGHWDTIALDHCLREAGQRATCDLLGYPGATSWQLIWFRFIDKRPLEIFGDYDPPREVNGKTIQPGWDGVQRIIKMAKVSTEFKPKSIMFREWKV